MLRVDQLTVRIQGRPVLDDVSLEVERGSVVGLLGPNGAGKTTCFRTVLGQLQPRRGSVLLDGASIAALPMHARARQGSPPDAVPLGSRAAAFGLAGKPGSEHNVYMRGVWFESGCGGGVSLFCLEHAVWSDCLLDSCTAGGGSLCGGALSAAI